MKTILGVFVTALLLSTAANANTIEQLFMDDVNKSFIMSSVHFGCSNRALNSAMAALTLHSVVTGEDTFVRFTAFLEKDSLASLIDNGISPGDLMSMYKSEEDTDILISERLRATRTMDAIDFITDLAYETDDDFSGLKYLSPELIIPDLMKERYDDCMYNAKEIIKLVESFEK